MWQILKVNIVEIHRHGVVLDMVIDNLKDKQIREQVVYPRVPTNLA